MSSDAEQTSTVSAKPTSTKRTLAKYLAAAVLALLGVFLLIATKSTAGSALLLAAMLVLLPVWRLSKGQQIAHWVRSGLVAVLVVLAIASIAGTDVPLDQARTGVKFVDQLLAIWHRFQENVLGSSPPAAG